MKQILLSAALLLSSAAFAAINPLDLIKQNPEVKSAIAAFEANRVHKCNELKQSNLQLKKNGTAQITVSCNQYDQNGVPQANVTFMTFKGALYPTFFYLTSITFTDAE